MLANGSDDFAPARSRSRTTNGVHDSTRAAVPRRADLWLLPGRRLSQCLARQLVVSMPFQALLRHCPVARIVQLHEVDLNVQYADAGKLARKLCWGIVLAPRNRVEKDHKYLSRTVSVAPHALLVRDRVHNCDFCKTFWRIVGTSRPRHHHVLSLPSLICPRVQDDSVAPNRIGRKCITVWFERVRHHADQPIGERFARAHSTERLEGPPGLEMPPIANERPQFRDGCL